MKQNVVIRFAEEADIPEFIALCRKHAEFERAEYDETGKAENWKSTCFLNPPG